MIVTDINQLKQVSYEVPENEDIAQIVADLFREMKEYDGWGLSAIQLGVRRRIFVMRLDPYSPVCFVNPVILKEKGRQLREETCLSLPGVKVMVPRPSMIVIQGFNQYFKHVRTRLIGLQARIACHEIDHCNGKLITDYE